jgi:hypothetical protein
VEKRSAHAGVALANRAALADHAIQSAHLM